MATAAERKRKSRALQSNAKREDERTANRERNRGKRETGRPKPRTVKDFEREAARVAPTTETMGGEPVASGMRVAGVGKVDVASADETSFGNRQSHGRKPLAEIVLGKGFDYNPEHTFGRPAWWPKGYEPDWWARTRPHYTADERRWIFYCLGFANRGDNTTKGRALEARGLEIATLLSDEARDVQWVAAWLRDGYEKVPEKTARHFSRQRVKDAMQRLRKLGLLKSIGNRRLIA